LPFGGRLVSFPSSTVFLSGGAPVPSPPSKVIVVAIVKAFKEQLDTG
jgi:hypothetical protein